MAEVSDKNSNVTSPPADGLKLFSLNAISNSSSFLFYASLLLMQSVQTFGRKVCWVAFFEQRLERQTSNGNYAAVT
jgi:hypothetical protein